MKIQVLESALTELSADRPIFHSEADFQHSLAWRIRETSPSATIRLEMPFRFLESSIYVDIFLILEGVRYGIELKYKTRGFAHESDGETYDLKNQSAQDTGRYDFLFDLQRVENLKSRGLIDSGASLFLTNDSAYWKSPRSTDTVDANFRIHDGRMVQGDLGWGMNTSEGTMSGREAPISLRETYELRWREYSKFAGGSYSVFRYLLLESGKNKQLINQQLDRNRPQPAAQ